MGIEPGVVRASRQQHCQIALDFHVHQRPAFWRQQDSHLRREKAKRRLPVSRPLVLVSYCQAPLKVLQRHDRRTRLHIFSGKP